jgi:tetratricopeptide (TPR) repeat protein
VWYRYAAFWAAKIVARLRKWLKSGWVIVFLLIMIIIFLQLVPFESNDDRESNNSQPPAGNPLGIIISIALNTIGATIFFILLFRAGKMRKRIALIPFDDFTGDNELKLLAKGIPRKLANHINRLTELFRTIDEINPESKKRLIKATVGIQDIGKNLKELVTPDQKIKIASLLEIPIGAIMAWIGRILGGPRLEGSLYMIQDKLELTAQISGGGLDKSWSVTSNDLDVKNDDLKNTEKVEKMTEQLIYRIFTDLVHVGSPRWRAVYRFTRGLYAYRRTLRKEKDKELNLRKAEEAFIAALNDDNKFVQCHYNLGVIYKELEKHASAEVAFREALKEDHTNADAYLELAMGYYNTENYIDALWFCEQAINLRPEDAQAWNLKGVICWDSCEDKLKDDNDSNEEKPAHDKDIDPDEENEEEYKKCIENKVIFIFEEAARLSWQALCRSILHGEFKPKLKNTARICMRNLAVVNAEIKKRSAKRIFYQSISISSGEGDLYFELGKFFFKKNKWKKAQLAFKKIFEDDPTLMGPIAFWAYYSKANAEIYERYKDKPKRKTAADYSEKIVLDGYKHFLYAVSNEIGNFPEAIDKHCDEMSGALNLIGKTGEADYILELLPDLLEFFSIRDAQQYDNLEEVEQEIFDESHEPPSVKLKDWKWAEIQFNIWRIKGFLSGDKQEIDFPCCIESLERTIEDIKGMEEMDMKREIKTHRLYGLLAQCYLQKQEKDFNKALYYARKAMSINPESPKEREILSEVYFALNDYELAQKEFENCLNLEPKDPDLHYIPNIRMWHGFLLRSPGKREKAFKAVIESLDKALMVMRYRLPGAEDRESLLEDLEELHFQLGVFHNEIKQYDEAISHYKIAGAMKGKKSLEAKIKLGWTYMEAKAYNKAEQTFRDAEKHFSENKPTCDKDRYFIEIQLGQAASIIERAVSVDKKNDCLKKPLELLKKAKKRIQKKGPEHLWYSAVYYECMGRIAFKKGDIRLAILNLEQSVSRMSSPRVYYFLAQAYWRHCWEAKSSEQRLYFEKAQEACILSDKCDKNEKYKEAVNKLQEKIDNVLSSI